MVDPTVLERAMALQAQIVPYIPWADLTPEQQQAWISKAGGTSGTSAGFIAG